jgi:hypothetical protein
MRTWSGTRAAAAGLAGTGAVAGAMALARRAGITRLDFPRILGTSLGHRRPSTRAAGWALFVANGALLALGYRAVLRIAGAEASLASGAAIGLAHGLIAAGGAGLLAPLHPRPREAGLASTASVRPPARALAVLAGVHVLYGAVLGGSAQGRT